MINNNVYYFVLSARLPFYLFHHVVTLHINIDYLFYEFIIFKKKKC